jgi:hypothetical protein
MQFTGTCRVVHDSNAVEFVYVAQFSSIVGGPFTVGEPLTFASGAVGVLLAIAGAEHTFVVTSAQQPPRFDDVTGDTSSATATISSFDTAPDLEAAGVTEGAIFIRTGDQVGYRVTSLESKSRVLLGATYGGASSDAAVGVIHSTRTPNFDLPSFDRRDSELRVLLNVLAERVDTVLQDHEDRLAALE